MLIFLVSMIIKNDFLVSKDNSCPSIKSMVFGVEMKNGYVITWRDGRGGVIGWEYFPRCQEIYFQDFDSLRIRRGKNKRVETSPEWKERYFGGVGDFKDALSFVWNEGPAIGHPEIHDTMGTIYFCEYDNKGNMVIKPKKLIDHNDISIYPSCPVYYSTNGCDKGLLCFGKERGDETSFYALVIDSVGEILLPLFLVDAVSGSHPIARGAISDKYFAIFYSTTFSPAISRMKVYSIDGKEIDRIVFEESFEPSSIEIIFDTIYVVWSPYFYDRGEELWLEKYVVKDDGVERVFQEVLMNRYPANMQVSMGWWVQDGGSIEVPSLVVMTAWHDWDEKKIKCRVYSALGEELGSGSFSPSVSDTATPDFSLFYGAGRFHIAYVDDSNRVIDVATYLTPDTELVFAGPQVVSDDTCGRGWSDARLAVNSNGDFAICYWCYYYDSLRAFVKFFDQNGEELSEEIEVPLRFTRFTNVTMAMDDERNLMIIHAPEVLEKNENGRPTRVRYYGVIVNPSGEVKKFTIGEYPPDEFYMSWHSYVACNSKGDFLILWCHFPGGDGPENVIRGRFFDANGRPKTDVFTLKFPLGPIMPTGADVFEDGGAVVGAAMPNAAESWAIVIDSTGNPLTGLIGFISTYPVIACDGKNRWVMAGLDVKPNYMVFDREGNVIKYLQVIDAYTFKWPSPIFPQQLWCGMDTSGRFIIYWTDFTEDANPDVRAQIFSRDGDPVSEIFEVHNPDAFPYEYQLSTWQGLGVTSDRIYFMWLDNRRIKGWDIYAKVTDWDYPTGIKEKRESKDLDIEYLGTHILISFSLSFPQDLSIKLYDVSGRVIKSIFLKAKKGENTIEIEKDFPPGVYFLRIEGKKIIKKEKVIIMK